MPYSEFDKRTFLVEARAEALQELSRYERDYKPGTQRTRAHKLARSRVRALEYLLGER